MKRTKFGKNVPDRREKWPFGKKIGKNVPDLPMAMGRSKKLGTGGGP